MPTQSTGPTPHNTLAGAEAAVNSTSTGRLTRRSALALTPLAALAAGCSSNKDKKDKAGTGGTTIVKNGTLDEVTYMTGFGSFGREAYAWVADAKGFFRDNGIKIRIFQGSGQPAELARLAGASSLDFYCVEAALAMAFMAKNTLNVKIVSAIHQRTAIALMALARSGIKRPKDLPGKKIAYGGVSPYLLFPPYARLAGFEPNVKWQMVMPQQLPAVLATGKVDVIGQFVTGAPLIKATARQDISVLPYGDYFGGLPGNLLLTNSDMINNKADLTHRFIDALMKGLDYAIKNPDESGTIMHQAVVTTSAAVATAELQAMKPYVITGGVPVGGLTPSGVTQAVTLLEDVGVVHKGALTAEEIVDFEFVPKAR